MKIAVLWSVLAMQQTTDSNPVSYSGDVAFLQQHADVIELHAGDSGWVAVSPALSGRVMTSAFTRADTGFGLVHRPAIEAGPVDRGFTNYGGEDRLWFAPEGGPHALYFDPGDPQDLEHWFVPLAMDGRPRTVAHQSSTEVVFRDRIQLDNYRGVRWQLQVERRIQLLTRAQISQLVGVDLSADTELDAVAFRSINRIECLNDPPVGPRRGLLSMWILGQFKPCPGETATRVFLPFRGGPENLKKDYFGLVPDDRLQLIAWPNGLGHTAHFTADSLLRSKIGIVRGSSTDWLGAHQPSPSSVTLVHARGAGAKDPVAACDWNPDNPRPGHGDVATSYNHGEEPRFFELETLSQALPEEVGAKLEHVHTTIHLAGSPQTLADLAKKLLVVDSLSR